MKRAGVARYWRGRSAACAAVALCALGLLFAAGCGRATPLPTHAVVTAAGGPLRIQIIWGQPPPVARRYFTWRLRITGPQDRPWKGGPVSVRWSMVGMAGMSGLPGEPPSTLVPLGAGRYAGRGLLVMGGRWRMTVGMRRDGQTLVVQLPVEVPE